MKMYEKEVDMYPDIIDSISKKLSFLGYKYKVFKISCELSCELRFWCER